MENHVNSEASKSRNDRIDQRNAQIEKEFSEKVAELKNSNFTISTMLDIVTTRLAQKYYLSKSTIRKIISGSQSPRRKSVVEHNRRVSESKEVA